MKVVGLLLGSFMLVAVAIVAIIAQPIMATRVYTIAEVQSGLRYHPLDWVDRTVLVRGRSATAVISPQGTGLLLPTVNGGMHYTVPAGAIFRAVIVLPNQRLGPVTHFATLTPRLWVSWQDIPPHHDSITFLTVPLLRLKPGPAPEDNGPGHIYHLKLLSQRARNCLPSDVCTEALVVGGEPSR